MRRIVPCLIFVLVGCFQPALPVRQFDPTRPATPTPIVVTPQLRDDVFHPASQSQSLARLAQRQSESASVTDGSRRLDAVLNELVRDGVPADYCARVRLAVTDDTGKPVIRVATKLAPARNLTEAEIKKLEAAR